MGRLFRVWGFLVRDKPNPSALVRVGQWCARWSVSASVLLPDWRRIGESRFEVDNGAGMWLNQGMSAWHDDPPAPDWFVPTHRRRDDHAYLVMAKVGNHNTSITYRPWREDLTRSGATSSVSTDIFRSLYERIPA